MSVIYQKLDTGYYYRPSFQNGTAGICPKGTFCTGALGTNFSEWINAPHAPLPCKSGTFNNFTRRGACRKCPEGVTCMDTGMAEPTICEAGYICWAAS